uniref:Uncharacterized protein n=2 Tax=viral metagenome TaxID=1070528 RepID=A0A6M3XSD3_9ZZZZ
MPDRKRLITLRPKGTGGIVPPTPLGEPIQTKPQLGKPLPLKTPPPQSREGVALYEPPGIEPPNEWLEAQLIELQDVAWKPRWEEIKKRADTTGYNIPDEVKDEKTFMDKWRSAGEQVIESPVMQVLGTVAGIALIVYGGYATATTGWRAFINSSLWRNINSYEKSVQKGNPKFSIPPETKNNFVTWAEQNLGKRWLTKNSIKTLFKPVQTGLRVPQEVAQQAESDVTALVKTKLPTFIPRGTQTGAMAFGGKYPPNR